MSVQLPTFMTKTILILFISSVLFLWGCSNKDKPSEDNTIDTLVSDHFLDDSEYDPTAEDPIPEVEEDPYIPPPSNNRTTTTTTSRGNGGGGSDSEADVVKYQNYERIGSNPDDFATAMIFPAIRMVYSDNFIAPKARVLNSTKQDGNYIIELAITWKDHWVPKYEIKGTLTVAEDGNNPSFVITEKNIEAEALEVTKDDFKTELTLNNI